MNCDGQIYKGWMQTFLVHMRQPQRLFHELGPGGFATFLLVVGGNAFVALVHPIFVVGLGWSVAFGAKGSIDWSLTPIHEYRDLWEIDDRIPQLAWLWQLNRGVFKSPGSKWESWTTSIVMSDEDAQRYVDNFESMAAAISQ